MVKFVIEDRGKGQAKPKSEKFISKYFISHLLELLLIKKIAKLLTLEITFKIVF